MDEVTIMKNQAKKYLDNADEKTIKMVFAMLEVDAQKDWWDEISDSAKNSIERGLKDIEMGKVTPHHEVMKKYKKWLS
jgi:predicted transcriptional regulator